MTDGTQYAPSQAGAVQSCQFWSAHVDALEHHLSANTRVFAFVTVVLMAYPIARILIPIVFHEAVPDVVRAVLSLM